MTYELPVYGHKLGLKSRMQEWARVLRENRGYLGLIDDLEAAAAVLPDDPPGSRLPTIKRGTSALPPQAAKPKPALDFDL